MTQFPLWEPIKAPDAPVEKRGEPSRPPLRSSIEKIHHGDCLVVLPTFAPDSIDACVTDPPYGIGFMGKEWDTFKPGEAASRNVPNKQVASDNPNLKGRVRAPASSPSAVEYDYSRKGLEAFERWTEQWAREVFRVLKPGAHILVCGAPRAYHRMACGLEDAGFDVRDCLAWLYGQGFPKSLNLGEGLGTALKPAHEPIVLARKPFKGTVKGNVERFGTGALNIGACRIVAPDGVPQFDRVGGPTQNVYQSGLNGSARNGDVDTDTGRWPANVVIDEVAAAVIDEQSGELISGTAVGGLHRRSNKTANCYGEWKGERTEGDVCYGDTGGASRFFYCAKPSREERDYGCWDIDARSSFDTVSRSPMSAGANNPRAGAGRLALLNSAEIVYPDAAWVSAVLTRRLPADTDTSRRKATAASTTQCSDGSAWSMCWCGSPSTDPFHPAVRSIIETEKSSTTESTTSNSSRRPHTNGCMAAAFGVTAAGGNLAAFAEFQSPWARLIGTSPKKAGPSTADADLATSIASWLLSAPAKPVVRRNGHPTVKPVELMRWLVKLVTPIGGVVLDPFLGSGTTGMAARYEQRGFIGIEREADYIQIAERRIAAVAPLFAGVDMPDDDSV